MNQINNSYKYEVCTDCHPHRKGFPSFTTVFNPIKRWLFSFLGTDSAYAKPPAWAVDGALPPGLQNHLLPEQFWENGLKKFKVSFEIVGKSTGQESSQSAIKDDIIYYYHNDHLGTPCFLTDEAGSIVWRREQTPFGVTSYERGTTTENLRFPGQYWDEETGLAQNWHRDYNAGFGRYVESDPIGFEGGINLYSYTDNNPAKGVDLNGLILHFGNRASETEFQDDIDVIWSSVKGKMLIQKLENDNKCHLIFKVNGLGDNTGSDGTNAYIDPAWKPLIDTENGRKRTSTARILAHELGHMAGEEDEMQDITIWENPVMKPIDGMTRTTKHTYK